MVPSGRVRGIVGRLEAPMAGYVAHGIDRPPSSDCGMDHVRDVGSRNPFYCVVYLREKLVPDSLRRHSTEESYGGASEAAMGLQNERGHG